MEHDKKIPPFQLLLESEEAEELSEYWQKQCCILYNAINRNIMEGSIEPLTCEGVKGERAGIITTFSVLLASGLSMKTFEHILDIINVWLENRQKSKVVMKFPNGNEIEISGVTGFSKSEVLGLFEKSLQASKV